MWRCSLAVNQNGFNSRITSEALEERFRQVFPAQAGAELIQDLYASGVIVPTIDFTSIAEGSFLPQNLQTAWDFATGFDNIAAGTTAIISTPGFWKVDWFYALRVDQAADLKLQINDGVTQKTVWSAFTNINPGTAGPTIVSDEIDQVIFLRAGDTLDTVKTGVGGYVWRIWYRQIADVNGNLVNPLGFTF
jgi:hypothetical protein